MKTAKEVIENKTKRSREKFDFDESIVDSLSTELRAAIGNAVECNIPYAAYYACKYREYNNNVLIGIIKLIDLSCYPEYWVERMLVKIGKYIDGGGAYINEYIGFLALYPQETAEDNLDFCMDYMFQSKYDRDQCEKELRMDKWELYYQFKAVKGVTGLVILKMTYSIHPFEAELDFLRALWDKINSQAAIVESMRNKDPKDVAKMFVAEAVVGNNKRMDLDMLNWYTRLIDQHSVQYKDILRYYESAGAASTLNIYFEEV